MQHPKRIGVVGTMASVPYAGMAWMHCQFLLGLARLGHEVFYVETTTAWPYHPLEMTTTNDPSYAVGYLQRVLEKFGLGDCWAYRAAYADGRWYGPLGAQAIDLIRSADAVFNITGSTTPEEIGVPCRLVYIGTDPVLQERISSTVLPTIENLELQLRRKLDGRDAGQVRTSAVEKAPQGYADAVAEYFRRLSRGKK